MAMWTMLGARGLDILGWESFGKGWITDAVKQLKLRYSRHGGRLRQFADLSRWILLATWPSLGTARPPACVPNSEWISDRRDGLTLCDATSAAFAMELPWEKLDVTTYSWQKVVGGEAAHGMLILSPRGGTPRKLHPPWPVPKVFRLTKGGKLIDGIFRGETINTPSMLAVEDYLDTLRGPKALVGWVVCWAASPKIWVC